MKEVVRPADVTDPGGRKLAQAVRVLARRHIPVKRAQAFGQEEGAQPAIPTIAPIADGDPQAALRRFRGRVEAVPRREPDFFRRAAEALGI